MTLSVFRNNNAVATLPVGESSYFTHKLMGEQKLVVETILPAPGNFQIGDYIDYEGEQFYINVAPGVTKQNNFTYRYFIEFEAETYNLYNKLYLDEGDADFNYFGTPNDFLLLLLDNINSIQAGWVIQAAGNADPINIAFSGDSCRTALTKIADAFEMEYIVSGKNIWLSKSLTTPSTQVFEYGRGKGLYTLSRNSIDRNNIVTRVFGFGARKNIGTDYRNGATRLLFEDKLLENNIDLYGVREGSVTFEDIFPNRTGAVTAIDANDVFAFYDDTLDFDINDQLIEGTVAKVVFKSGLLSGYQFEIKRYLNATQKFEILPFSQENGYTLPNPNFKPVVGDSYTLVDMDMPKTYIDAAELALQEKTQTYLDENSVPRVTYAIDIDEKYVRDNGVELSLFSVVRIVDAALGIDAEIRISEISYPLLAPDQLSATISDTVAYTTQERLIAETVNNGTIVRNIDIRQAELARQSVSRLRQMQDLVFDPDGYFNGDNIKPNSVETLMLSVGAKSQNFGLNGVTIEANAGGNPNVLSLSAGQLVHYEIEIDGLGYIWVMSPGIINTLVSGTPYYVYARCSKTQLTGTWQVSSVPKETEEEVGQYLFNVGILYAVDNGRRDFDFTKGMTFISGDTITTGRIESLDGLSFFDLSQGQFKAGNSNSSIDWNVSNPNKLTLRGSIIQNDAGQEVILTNFRGDYVAQDFYTVNDVVSYNGSLWRCIQSIGGVAPIEGQYWTTYVSKGDDGNDGAPIVYRGEHSPTAVYYNNPKRRDVVIRNDIYYRFIGNDATSGAFVANNWENFGAQFESVATNLLLAENANIADLIIVNGKISSQAQYDGAPTMVLDGGGQIKLQNQKTIERVDGVAEPTNFNMLMTALSGQITLFHESTANQSFGSTSIDSEGIKASYPGKKLTLADGGTYWASVVGDARAQMNWFSPLAKTAMVGVMGKAENLKDDAANTAAPAFGGMFWSLMAKGLFVKTKHSAGSSLSLDAEDVFVYSDQTVFLPAVKSGADGRVIIIWASGTISVHKNGAANQPSIENRITNTIGSPISMANRVGLFIYSNTTWKYTPVY